ncbi:MAG: alpha/beta hydrolase [Bacteroidetes bacterium]|nr:alpha/beta hydrolase [Bacteroidota bacterium]
MNVYFISGLGADERVFKHISLPEGYEAVYLKWIDPLKNETLTDYSLRMAGKIDMTKPFIIIGLSMGGMIASEISRHFKPETIILISSIPTASDLPPYMTASGKFKLYDWIPIGFLKSATIIKRLFVVESAEDRLILKKMVEDCDESFIRWGMAAISTWKESPVTFNYTHIHGNNDLVLPMRYTKPTHIIPKGGHFMIVNRAKEVNEIIKKILANVKM